MASSRRKLGVALAFVASASTTTSLARNASAFCRTTTVAVAPDFSPRGTQCWDKGLPLWWRNECVGYSLQKAASKQIGLKEANTMFAEAFAKWTEATCPTSVGGSSRPSIDVRDNGPVTCSTVEYDKEPNGRNQHVIVFRDDKWPHADTDKTLALTTVTFNPETGELYDADMEVNTTTQMTLRDPVPGDGYDFASVITHEVGHFLGLAHSGESQATMFATYTPGSTRMRNLTEDDVAGICTVYAPGGARAVAKSVDATGKTASDKCNPEPRKGFSTECIADRKPEATKACSASPPTLAPSTSAVALVSAVCIAGLARRRRKNASL
jgi:hypothetical protein